jgi:hypothetical protein
VGGKARTIAAVLDLIYVAIVMYAMTRQAVYAVMLDEIAESSRMASGSRDLPTLAEWAIRNIKATNVFLIGAFPLIAITISRQATPVTVRFALVFGGIGLIGLVIWTSFMWFGLDFVIMKFGELG